jgi:phospholipid/cholesterol/gamma-HCH transport system ATP-binding protein
VSSDVTSGDRPAVIEAEDVHVAFGEKKVLRGVSLRVLEGETVALLGESGSGKTVFLRTLLGLQALDRGVVRLLGTDLAGLDDDEMIPLRQRCSVVYQGGALWSGMTVAENIALELKEVLKLSDADAAVRVKESLEAVGLGDVDPSLVPQQLSGGMQKRLAVARAIAPRPEIIFYDEPTSGLDPVNSARILELIRSMHDRMGVTSVVVTHDVRGASRIADRLALLAGGRLAFDGPPKAFETSTEPVVVAYRSSAPGFAGYAAKT